jgi:hypothetical protein
MRRTFNGVMRAVSTLLGLLMIAMGTVWILQGLGIAFLDSFMANKIQWTFWGVLRGKATLRPCKMARNGARRPYRTQGDGLFLWTVEQV